MAKPGHSSSNRSDGHRSRWSFSVFGLLAVAGLAIGVVYAIPGPKHPQPAAAARPTRPRPTSSSTATSSTTATTRPTTTTTRPAYQPPPVAPRVAPAIAGEGAWVPVDTWDPGPAPILTTVFRPDPSNPQISAYVAWIRTSSAQVALYPGYKGPGPTSLDRGPEMVPVSARPDLLATFNSGFYEADAPAGFYTHATLYHPMVDGLATLVEYASGRTDIVAWTGGASPPAGVVMARQNLSLMVDAGAPTAGVAVPSQWGLTLHGAPRVWRTALGIDRAGNLMYVAAPSQTAASLAQILVDVGAVRGMQLDINPEWPILVTYGGPGAVSPALFVPNPNQVPYRFLYSSTKDFFAVYKRSPAAGIPPW